MAGPIPTFDAGSHSPHESLVQWLEEELRRAIHTTPPDLAEIGRLTMAIQECRRGWLREKMT